HEHGPSNAEREARPVDYGARPLKIDKGIVRDDRTAARSEMSRKANQEPVEQTAPAGAAGTPSRQPLAQRRCRRHREMRQVGGDQVEAAPSTGRHISP